MTGKPQAMVVLASEQLWPGIQGPVFWHEHQGGLAHLFIYHTADQERSARPARRLARLCRELYGTDIEVHLPDRPKTVRRGGVDESINPQAVRRQIEDWRQRVPDHTLVINATGGLKLMFAGVLGCLNLPGVQVGYRELGHEGWYRLERTDAGLHAEPFEVSPHVTDHIPVQNLVGCQWEPEGAHWTWSDAEPLPILELVRAGVDTHWNWGKMFAACGLPSTAPQGLLFERFVAGTLLALGVPQVGRNYILHRHGNAQLEVDVVANYGGRLLVIDCKIGKDIGGTVVRQCSSAAELRRRMGGAGAAMLLLRPNKCPSQALCAFAEMYSLQLLTSSDTRAFFYKLQAFCGIQGDLPPELAAAQQLLDDACHKNVGLPFVRRIHKANRPQKDREPKKANHSRKDREPKGPRRKLMWGVFNSSMKCVAQYEHSDREAAEQKAKELTVSADSVHFVKPLKQVLS